VLVQRQAQRRGQYRKGGAGREEGGQGLAFAARRGDALLFHALFREAKRQVEGVPLAEPPPAPALVNPSGLAALVALAEAQPYPHEVVPKTPYLPLTSQTRGPPLSPWQASVMSSLSLRSFAQSISSVINPSYLLLHCATLIV